MNSEFLAPLGEQLLPLTSTSVQAAGVDEVPAGLAPFEPDEDVTAASGDPVVLGRFTGAEHRYVLLANYSREHLARIQVTFGDGTAERFEPRTGAYRSARERIRLEPGGAELLRFS